MEKKHKCYCCNEETAMHVYVGGATYHMCYTCQQRLESALQNIKEKNYVQETPKKVYMQEIGSDEEPKEVSGLEDMTVNVGARDSVKIQLVIEYLNDIKGKTRGEVAGDVLRTVLDALECSTEIAEYIKQISLANGRSTDEVASNLLSLAHAGKIDTVGADMPDEEDKGEWAIGTAEWVENETIRLQSLSLVELHGLYAKHHKAPQSPLLYERQPDRQYMIDAIIEFKLRGNKL